MNTEDNSNLITNIIGTIKKRRKEKGINHTKIAKMLDISPSAYNKIENQNTKLTMERFLELQQILNIEFSEVFEIKPKNIYNQDLKEHAVGHQEVENLYHDNQELTNQFIESLQEEIKFLKGLLKESKPESA